MNELVWLSMLPTTDNDLKLHNNSRMAMACLKKKTSLVEPHRTGTRAKNVLFFNIVIQQNIFGFFSSIVKE